MIEEDGMDLQELMDYSGYSAPMIYDLTARKVLPRPIRGLSDYPSKGLYDPICKEIIDEYKRLKMRGMKKADIVKELQHVYIY